MKLVPLGDRVVLKQCRSRREQQNPVLSFAGQATGKTTAGRSYRCRTWRCC